MPFDSLASPAAATADDYRRRPDGHPDYDYYRQLARREQALAVGRALSRLANRCAAALRPVLAAWHTRRERARMRRRLLTMDDRMLRDIGLSRCDASLGIPRAIHRP